jgi:adenosylcobinamide-GDP ribazoletransferase
MTEAAAPLADAGGPGASWLSAPRDALGFLTRIPVGGGHLAPGQLGRAALFFPAVGLLVGGVAAGVRAGAGAVLPDAPATVLALLAAIVVTGGLHEDGLADTADGLGAHVDRARRLEIMRDSRVGTYGALAVAGALLFAFAALAPLGPGDFALAVLCGHVLSRWSVLPHSRLPRARVEGAGAALEVGPGVLAAGTAYSMALVLAIGGLEAGGWALAGAVVIGALCAAGVRHVLGGVTGDTFGAASKLTELTVYGVFAAVLV